MRSRDVLASVDGFAIDHPGAWRLLRSCGAFPDVVTALLEQHLLERAASRRGIEISDEDLQEASDDERRALALHAAADTFAWLAERWLEPEDWERIVEAKLRRRLLARSLFEPAEVEGRFEKLAGQLTEASVSILVVSSRDEAQEILTQVRSEEVPFAALARRHSLDLESRMAGGMLGRVRLEGFFPALRDAVAESAGGDEVVGPVERDGLWYLVQVAAVGRPELDAAIRAEIEEQLLAEWLETERLRSRIEVTRE